MDKIIKKFTKGKYVLKVNNKEEFNLLLSFIKKKNIKRTPSTGKFPKYFYIKHKKLIRIFSDDIISLRLNRISFFEYTKRICFLTIEMETVKNKIYIDMRKYIISFKKELNGDRLSLWRRFINTFKYKKSEGENNKVNEHNEIYSLCSCPLCSHYDDNIIHIK